MTRKASYLTPTDLDSLHPERRFLAAVDEAFAESGPFEIEHRGDGELRLTTKSGVTIVAYARMIHYNAGPLVAERKQ